MMTTTIAIIGHNGNVGKKVLPHLIKAHQAGQIKLVVLHRPSSAVDSVPSTVERRVMTGTDPKSLKSVVKGVNVLLSTIGHEGFALQESLLDALAGSPDIVTFIPASFGAVWTEEILQKPAVRAFHEPYDRLSAKAKELGIGFTQVRAGLFLEFTFMAGFVGIDAKNNKIELYKDALNKPFLISELHHLAAAIANVALRNPASIANKNFYTYTFSPTGQELIDLFTAHNASAPVIEKYTDEQYEKDTDVPGFSVVGATYRRRWGEGVWGWDSIDAEWVDVEGPKETFEKLSKPFFAK